MAFNNSHFPLQRTIRNMRKNAEQVLVATANKCTCGVEKNALTSQRADPNCIACQGWGFFYEPWQAILAVASEYDLKHNPLEMALVQPGDMMLAPLPRERLWLSTYDLVRFPYWERGEAYEGELVIRSTDSTDTLKYPINLIQRVTQVSDTAVITTFLPTVDYSFTKFSQLLSWVPGRGPYPGSIYSIRYSPIYDWVVYTPASERYARGTSLGQRVLLRKRTFVQNTSPLMPQNAAT